MDVREESAEKETSGSRIIRREGCYLQVIEKEDKDKNRVQKDEVMR